METSNERAARHIAENKVFDCTPNKNVDETFANLRVRNKKLELGPSNFKFKENTDLERLQTNLGLVSPRSSVN